MIWRKIIINKQIQLNLIMELVNGIMIMLEISFTRNLGGEETSKSYSRYTTAKTYLKGRNIECNPLVDAGWLFGKKRNCCDTSV